MLISDYKTGKTSPNWSGKDEYDRIKLHKYKQQLMFYKLLVENSRNWHDYRVDEATLHFIEPAQNGEIYILNTTFNDSEMKQFKELLLAVWKHIIILDLPDISKYDKSLKGILAFEQDLVDDFVKKC